MSYCRFENTLHYLEDCDEVLRNEEKIDEKYELPAAISLIKLCRDIAEKFESMTENEIKIELDSWKN
jgi:hypothetical protein